MIIAYFCISTHLGGAERSLLDEVLRLEKASEGRYKPWVLLPKTTGPLIDRLKEAGIDYDVLEMPKDFLKTSRKSLKASTFYLLSSTPELILYFSKLRKLIQSKNPALIHSTGLKCHLLSSFLERPTLWFLRDILPEGKLQQFMKLLSKRSQIHLVANSKATADSLSPKMPVIHNGFAREEYLGERENFLHEKLGLPKESQLVGLVGALAHWKGQKEFIQIAKEVLKKQSHVHFVIIGDEIYDTEGEKGLKAEISRQIVDNPNIHLLSFQKEIKSVFKSLDVLAHVSTKPEPFGRVIVESMACGTPVVAAKAGGVLEIIENEKDGLLCPPADISGYAKKISRLLENSQLRESLAKNGFETFLNRFEISKHMKKLVNLYDQILQNK